MIERLKNIVARWWPALRLRTILFGVLLFAAAMPAIGAISLRVFENTLVRQTEAELVAQGAALTAVAAIDWPGAPTLRRGPSSRRTATSDPSSPPSTSAGIRCCRNDRFRLAPASPPTPRR